MNNGLQDTLSSTDQIDSGETILSCSGLSKSFQEGRLNVQVLNGVSVSIGKGEQVAILGSSGSGKSTLLHLLGGLDLPDSGEVNIAGKVVAKMSDKARSKWRNLNLGFVYQFHHLMQEFTALENVAMPLLIRGLDVATATQRATSVLEKVGLVKRLLHKPAELSGGERQRAAIARALVTEPQCVLADEPTGNLDNKTANSVYETMLTMNAEFGTSFVIVTHDQKLAERMDRVYTLENGLINTN